VSGFAIFCLCLTVGLAALGIRFRRRRIVFLNLAAAVLATGFYEIYISGRPIAETTYREGSYVQGHFTHDPELGYVIAAGPRSVTSVLKRADGSVIYDVKYTIDRYGLRPVVPGARTAENDKAVFFFGDSFTFGEGVNDGDTLPQRFSDMSGLRTVNFGINGYGAHQVLRELETDRPRTVERRDPLAIIYVVLPWNHMYRAAGRSSWDKEGPHYEIVDGVPKYIGHFTADNPFWKRMLEWSNIYTKKFEWVNSGTDRERLLAITARIRDLSISKYHAPFFVVLWDVSLELNSDAQWLREKLRKAGVPTLAISAAIPELQSARYYIQGDGHPNSEGYALVAEALNAFLGRNFRAASFDPAQAAAP
jgi:lysophospholipase L1-like esterase